MRVMGEMFVMGEIELLMMLGQVPTSKRYHAQCLEENAITQQWNLYARYHSGMDVRELRQQLLNCADGPLEAAMYDALGRKIDTLSETDMMEELEKLAVEEIVAVVKNVCQGQCCQVHRRRDGGGQK
jgi:hypothetical protein